MSAMALSDASVVFGPKADRFRASVEANASVLFLRLVLVRSHALAGNRAHSGRKPGAC